MILQISKLIKMFPKTNLILVAILLTCFSLRSAHLESVESVENKKSTEPNIMINEVNHTLPAESVEYEEFDAKPRTLISILKTCPPGEKLINKKTYAIATTMTTTPRPTSTTTEAEMTTIYIGERNFISVNENCPQNERIVNGKCRRHFGKVQD